MDDPQTVVIEGDVVADEGSGGGDAALAYEQGLAVGAVAAEAAQTAELAEETAEAVEIIQEQGNAEWQLVSTRLEALESRIAAMENQQTAQALELEEIVAEEIAAEEMEQGREAEPVLEVAVPEPEPEPEQEQTQAGIFAPPGRARKKLFRLP